MNRTPKNAAGYADVRSSVIEPSRDKNGLLRVFFFEKGN
jgi:hypothetical protein